MADTTCGKYCPLRLLRIKQMAEPTSVMVPLALAGVGGGVAAAVTGVDVNAVLMAFAGAAMFAFVSKGTSIPLRIGLLLTAWIFGYYASLEIVQREIWGFKSPPLPSFVAAFFCVAVFKLLLAIFDEEGRGWLRKKLGLSTEGPKDE